MNTPDSTTAPSARLQTVQQLLEKLGSMKAEGLGARERIDFLQVQGPELAEDFSIEDAFDADARASSTRIAQLGELSSHVQQLETTWRGAPISSDIRDAGSNLIGHINGFVKEAQKLEHKSEIDMLSQLWEHGPDVTDVWPELTAWGPKPRPSSSKNVRQLKTAKDRLENELIDENLSELPTGADQLEKPEFESGSSSPELIDEFETARHKGELERQARDLDQGKHMRRDFKLEQPDEVVVATVSGKSGSSLETHDFEDMPKLRQQAWTEAIREATLRPWQLQLEASSSVGSTKSHDISMMWILEHDEGAYIRLEITRDLLNKQCRVRLEWTNPKVRTTRLEREFSSVELLELHLDPSSFVEQALIER